MIVLNTAGSSLLTLSKYLSCINTVNHSQYYHKKLNKTKDNAVKFRNVKRENEKSICHWCATLSFQPLHSSGILLHILFKNKENKITHTT